MNNDQEGGVILADLLNLGMPLGLTVLAAQKKKSEKKEQTKEKFAIIKEQLIIKEKN